MEECQTYPQSVMELGTGLIFLQKQPQKESVSLFVQLNKAVSATLAMKAAAVMVSAGVPIKLTHVQSRAQGLH